MNYAKSVVVSPVGILVTSIAIITNILAFVSVVIYFLMMEINSAMANRVERLSRWTER